MPLARFFALAAVFFAGSSTRAQVDPPPPRGLTPEEALARMVLPEGFHAELVAAEPTIRQPVAAVFDERGRLWVVEYLQYPNPAGLKPLTVDQYLRTEYDRVPEPPPRGPRGADRITILHDPDGDGRFEKVATFVEGLNLASAIAIGRGGVFVVQAPYLLFYPDRDRDDRPDSDPEVLLTGFGLQDAHAVANSLTWGPDGWLYGAQGSTVTARINGVEFQQGIWRYHPESRRFELFAEGGGNTWGLDFDRFGRILGSSNGGFIAFHMVQGGYYWKGFAKHGPLHNPRAYGYFDALAYDGPKRGGHVTPGGIVYKGGTYPSELDGAFIGGNLLSNAVYWHILSERGSTLKARHGGTLLDARDPWFRPVDLLTGPDGCVHVVDWHDRRASHLDPRDTWDRSNGRIYRIVHGHRPPVEPFDLATWPTSQLVAQINDPNDWWAETTRRVLFDRRDPTPIPDLKAQLDAETTRPERALKLLWALDACGGLTDEAAYRVLKHPLAPVRAWAVRRLGDDIHHFGPIPAALASLARGDDSVLVRSQLAASAQRWPAYVALPILLHLAARDEDASDPFLPLQIWWGFETLLRQKDQRATVVDRLAAPDLIARPLVRDHLLERLARALASDPDDHVLTLLNDLLARAGDTTAPPLLRGLDRGLEGVPRVPDAPLLAARVRGFEDVPGLRPLVLRVAARLHDPSAYAAICDGVSDPSVPNDQRLALVDLLGQIRGAQGRRTLLAALEAASEPDQAIAVLNALAGYDHPDVAAALVRRYAALNPAGRDRVRGLLASRPTWAESLVSALESKAIPPADLRPAQAAQLAVVAPQLVPRLEAAWGRVAAQSPEAVVRRIAEVRGVLPEGDKGDPARGRLVFEATCAGCHRLFGAGGAIGPDLSGAERSDLDFLLTSIVDPSAFVRGEYQGQTVALSDGRVLTGLVAEETANTLTLVDSQQQRTTIPRDQIEEISPATQSVMPAGLLDTLSEDQIRDLFRYLQSTPP
jgi:putative membrane-bound dehydrogenase-like protein